MTKILCFSTTEDALITFNGEVFDDVDALYTWAAVSCALDVALRGSQNSNVCSAITPKLTEMNL